MIKNFKKISRKIRAVMLQNLLNCSKIQKMLVPELFKKKLLNILFKKRKRCCSNFEARCSKFEKCFIQNFKSQKT